MKRLYLRIYLAVLASLVVFALAAGLLWRFFGEARFASHAYEVTATVARNVLPAAGAAREEQLAALRRLAADLRVDVSLYSPERGAIASVGNPLPLPDGDRTGLVHRFGGPPLWVVRLQDGRWLVARLPPGRGQAIGLFLTLAGLALAVGVGAYPVVRRLTRRLERLQAGVEALGAGELSARVRVEGRDEVARLAESFNRAAGRIEELLRAHKSLLANASHELRTPLARIRMAVELMKESADAKRKSGLEQDIAELDALLDEILLASRLDALDEPQASEEVDLLALCAEECARYDGTQLEGEPLMVRGDPRLLRRMIRNLLENAKRHGAPPIDVRVSRVGERVDLAVCDRGPGVPEAGRERVFDPFYRAGAGQGAGLGLALVRQIARRHGGEARCAANDGQGSCFIVALPIAR